MSHGLTNPSRESPKFSPNFTSGIGETNKISKERCGLDLFQHENLDERYETVVNPVFIPYTDHPHTENPLHLEEWQLVPDELLVYLTDNTSTSLSSDDLKLFKGVAHELRSCLQKLNEIRDSHQETFCSGSAYKDFSFVQSLQSSGNYLERDIHSLPGFLIGPQIDLTLWDDDEHTDDSGDIFSSVTYSDYSLSSLDLNDSCNCKLETQPRLKEVDQSLQTLNPKDLPVRNSQDQKEHMFSPLVQDLRWGSSDWASSIQPNFANTNVCNMSNCLIDKQPQTALSDFKELARLNDPELVTISYDLGSSCSCDSYSFLVTNGRADSGENRSCYQQPRGIERQKSTGSDEHPGNSSNKTGSDQGQLSEHSVSLDQIQFTSSFNSNNQQTVQPGQDLHNSGKKATSGKRLKRWWSAGEDKRDINLIKLPSVPSYALILNVDQNGVIRVGEGSFGTVFLADLYLNHGVYQVVVKDFSPKGVTKPSEILEEAKVLMHLSDTAFIPFFYGVLPVASPQRFALVQEFFAQGLNLHNILEDKSVGLSQISWINVCVQMAVGLDTFHRKGILLNDIKKDNILVDCRSQECIVKYIDMGLASYKTGRVFHGSEDYMQQFSHLAPEVRRMERTSPASDMYSIGKIFVSVSKTAPLRQISEFVLPCMSQCPDERPSIREIVCKLLRVREYMYKNPAGMPLESSPSRRWFC